MFSIITALFVSGLLSGAGPCLATCGPLLISYAAGTRKDIKKSIAAYLLFSLGRVAVYLVFGVVVFFFGRLASMPALGSFSRYVFVAGGVFIISLGLLITLGRNLEHKFCRRIQGFLLDKDAKTMVMLGLIIGLIPCAPLLSILSYIGLVSKSWLSALLYSLSFGLGTVISPLFILAGCAGLIPKIISRDNLLYRAFNIICGLIIIILGVQLIARPALNGG